MAEPRTRGRCPKAMKALGFKPKRRFQLQPLQCVRGAVPELSLTQVPITRESVRRSDDSRPPDRDTDRTFISNGPLWRRRAHLASGGGLLGSNPRKRSHSIHSKRLSPRRSGGYRSPASDQEDPTDREEGQLRDSRTPRIEKRSCFVRCISSFDCTSLYCAIRRLAISGSLGRAA